jgi:hypothetical protein
MQKFILFIFTVFVFNYVFGGTINGEVSSAKDQKPLPFASILVKGTTIGVSANAQGKYSLQLDPGEYILICSNVGFATQEKKVSVTKGSTTLSFELEPRQYDLKDVVVTSGGEDPAYAIMRKAIAAKTEHLEEIKSFTCDVYLKGQLQLRDFPKKFFGEKVDFEDGDSSKRKMIFLSETIAKYSRESAEKQKIEVISTKVSGRSDGFGFSSPQIVTFYKNMLSLGSNLNPRGFISPLSDNAFAYYKFKFEGTYFEHGKEVSRIKVIPKRKFEPLFAGYISIVENDWRLESVDLSVYKEQQMQFLDTLTIRQQYVPASGGWVVKNQIIYPAGKFFGFDFFGSFVQVYDNFNLSPSFNKKTFGNTILKFADSSNKKTIAYWDSIRPLPLLPEEIKDYKKKDSLEQVRKDPKYLDSIDRVRNKISIPGLLFIGESFSKQKNKLSISIDPLLQTLSYNSVEAAVIKIAPTIRKEYEGRRYLELTPSFRYGFANKHFNPSLEVDYVFGKKYFKNLTIAGGRNVFQYNNANPISDRANTIYTLIGQLNYQKLYEANFLKIDYTQGIGNGLSLLGSIAYQDREALNNLPDIAYWGSDKGRVLTPNYPYEITSVTMPRNQALLLSAGFSWRPGAKYVEFPDRKVSTGSKYPTISGSITQGVQGVFGSDANFTKWRFSVSDDLNMKLFGRLNYRYTMGGFLNANNVALPDYNHVLGNQTIFASSYLNSFQLQGYYRYSNMNSFQSAFHLEYHLNGFITNKIPGFKKLNWFVVTGGNILGINDGRNYYEYFIGLENILKVIRVDFVQGFEKQGARPTGFRISFPFAR